MKRAGVIGWPVAHSLSPVLHGYWLQQYGIDGTYEKIPAAPEAFVATIARLRGEGYAGVNVTVPHKEAAFALADRAEDAAKLAGAANLLVFRNNGPIYAENTDTQGLAKSISEQLGPGKLFGKVVVVLGAGGAARAAVAAMKSPLGAARIHILNRDAKRAENLARNLAEPGSKTELIPGSLKEWTAATKTAALVVNSTSAGMDDSPSLDLNLAALQPGAVVCDIVYRPLETQLLKDAKARGHRTIDGLGMLMHQAVPSFEAFFGVRPEVTPGLRAALVEALAAH